MHCCSFIIWLRVLPHTRTAGDFFIWPFRAVSVAIVIRRCGASELTFSMRSGIVFFDAGPTLNLGIVYWDMLTVKIHPSSPSSSPSPSPPSPSPFLFLSHSLFLSLFLSPLPLHHLPTNLDWRHVILMIIPRVLTTWISWLDNVKGHFFLQCGLTVWRRIKTHQYSLWNRFYSLIIQGHSPRSWGGHWWMRGSVIVG